jgi:hypothetical protein
MQKTRLAISRRLRQHRFLHRQQMRKAKARSRPMPDQPLQLSRPFPLRKALFLQISLSDWAEPI